MRLVILSLFFSASFGLSAQYDTSLITKAFEYIKTEEFKTALRNYTESEISKSIETYPAIRKRAGKFRKEEISRMNFWIINTCLIPKHFYLIADTTRSRANVRDTISYRQFDTLLYNRSPASCSNAILISHRFLNSQTIELEYFSGQEASRVRFGESNILRLKKVEGKLQFVSRGTIFWN